jgi:PKD repeat protein
MKPSVSLHRSCCVSLAALALLGMAGAADAQTHSCVPPLNLSCGFLDCRSPASGVPSQLWGDLRPVDTGELPSDRDNTDYNEYTTAPGSNQPQWTSIDIENNWIFAAITEGMQIWNATSPGAPTRVSVIGRASFPNWIADPHEDQPVRDLDAPPGNDDVVAVTVSSGGGLAIFSTANKNSPVARYGDIHKTAVQVYAGQVNGVAYSFTATRDAGLVVHNMTAAAARSTLCTEETPGQQVCGVYVGRLGSRTSISYVDGVSNAAGNALWVADSSGGTAFGMEIWNVSNPASPVQAISALTNEFVHGVTLWRNGTSYYLAVRVISGSGTQARIYNVSCLASGSCGGLGSPVWSRNLPGDAGEYFNTYSSGSGRDFLYFGSINRCFQGTQGEFLYDVSSPAQAYDITPPDGSIQVFGQPALTGYWGWYYRRNPTGYNGVGGRVGKFNGSYFYRAAFSIFDIHQLTAAVAPTASFTHSPSQVYQGQPVAFTDTSLGNPTSWAWTFAGATPGTSAAQNPSGVVFNSTGAKQVCLTATNGVGSNQHCENVNVLDPSPAVAGVTATPNPALVCQPITFQAQGVSGNPTPALSWDIHGPGGGGGTVATCGSVNPCVWNTSSPLPTPGTYTATVTASNTAGSAQASSPAVALSNPPTLPAAGTFTPTNDPFTAGTVQFHVVVAGATEWNWDFGDGNTTGWLSDPVAGPNPVHTYSAIGSYPVTVQVRNCIEAARTSDVLTVQITQIAPLVAHFQAQGCGGFGCFFTVGQLITFADTSQGSPTGWRYDWTHIGFDPGTCTFAGTPAALPSVTHSYGTAGNFQPCLEVSRGADTDVYVHELIVVGSGGGTPSITISGPATGQTGQALSFTASASNCTPNPSGWSWTAAGGGVVSGTISSSQVSITWSGAGTWTVTASNSACGSAVGSRAVTITAPSGGGGGVTAHFSFTPSSPTTGQQVAFDGSASTGSPDGYGWTFGDGDSASGVQANHVYANAGSYQVTLEVSKFDPSNPDCGSFGVCTDSVSHAVVVTAAGPPPLTASFTANVECTGNFCLATAGEPVTFTSTDQGATTFAWDFGDGGTATGRSAAHTFANAGDYTVTHTVHRGDDSASSSKTFHVEAGATHTSNVVLPWIAKTTGAVDQSSDLYVTNPSDERIEVTITFRRRGLPENPPPVTNPLPIRPHETLYFPDVLAELFDRGDAGGFLLITAEDVTTDPVVSSLNRVRQEDGTVYGQMVPGVTMEELDRVAATGSGVEYLLGLSDTADRQTYFGVTNPHDEPAEYTLRFFDKLGQLISGPSEPQLISRWGLKQYQIEEIRDSFGVVGQDDYRVEIRQTSGSTLYGYAGVFRAGTQDPSFVRASVPDVSRIYLVGAASTPGFNGAHFLTDGLLSNPSGELMQVDLTYRNVGLLSSPEPTRTLSLQPYETRRISDLLFDQWGIENSVGVLTFDSAGAAGLFPMIQGETYQNSGPGTQYGLFMPARRDAEAAVAGQRVVFSGLRQKDGDSNTTVWLFNPGDQNGSYDLVYYGLDGSELGRVEGYVVGAGGIRQINPSAHPLPEGGVDGGFSLAIEVTRGKLIAGADVVVNVTNDPAYVAGVVR